MTDSRPVLCQKTRIYKQKHCGAASVINTAKIIRFHTHYINLCVTCTCLSLTSEIGHYAVKDLRENITNLRLTNNNGSQRCFHYIISALGVLEN